MRPFEQAVRWHEANCPGESLTEMVEAHFLGGHVVAGPELFLMGRRVGREWENERLCDPWQVDPDGTMWHVWLFAGDIYQVRETVPYPLPWVSFHRRGRLVRMPFERAFPRGGRQMTDR